MILDIDFSIYEPEIRSTGRLYSVVGTFMERKSPAVWPERHGIVPLEISLSK